MNQATITNDDDGIRVQDTQDATTARLKPVTDGPGDARPASFRDIGANAAGYIVEVDYDPKKRFKHKRVFFAGTDHDGTPNSQARGRAVDHILRRLKVL